MEISIPEHLLHLALSYRKIFSGYGNSGGAFLDYKFNFNTSITEERKLTFPFKGEKEEGKLSSPGGKISSLGELTFSPTSPCYSSQYRKSPHFATLSERRRGNLHTLKRDLSLSKKEGLSRIIVISTDEYGVVEREVVVLIAILLRV